MSMRTFEGHPLTCECPMCTETARLRAQHITYDAPTNSLPGQSVSLRELVDNATLTTTPRYSIGEDWSDD